MKFSEMPIILPSKSEVEEEALKMKQIMENRRKITSPVAANHQDYQEAHEKVERDKYISQEKNFESMETTEIQEIIDMVLFDWDGVLYDSMEKIAKGAVEVCKNFGVDVDVNKFMATYDQPYQAWYEKLGVPASNEEAHKYIRCLYHNEIMPLLSQEKENMIFGDVVKTLQDLKKRGLKIGIVSADKKDNILKVLDENNIGNLFDCIFDRADNKTECIRNICRENQMDPARVLMVGDLPSDIRDAKKAGVKTAGMARNEMDRDRLGSYDPDYLLGGLGDEILKLKTYVDNSNLN
ncbi:MAG: hypothetical protein ACD_15C00212G0023 [uncultured bacterium]|nr:MAG: hypothetical protein ACD_15C00212G0023 [uncultured bacterium]